MFFFLFSLLNVFSFFSEFFTSWIRIQEAFDYPDPKHWIKVLPPKNSSPGWTYIQSVPVPVVYTYTVYVHITLQAAAAQGSQDDAAHAHRDPQQPQAVGQVGG